MPQFIVKTIFTDIIEATDAEQAEKYAEEWADKLAKEEMVDGWQVVSVELYD